MGSKREEMFDERPREFLLVEYWCSVRSMMDFERVGGKELFLLFVESFSKTNRRWRKRIRDSCFDGSTSLGRALISLSIGVDEDFS